ncbi:MAG: sigma-70 family RNA polymerase sigma factor [Armatimonadetes bacterium]|nr:sigma-70 family RNA polymerase sigma factor [Armatimonadota bacterium]
MDASEFERLITPELPAAYRYALRLTRSREDASDVIQEASLSAFRARNQFELGTSFRAWFFKIVTNHVYQRARKRTVDQVSIEDAPDAYIYRQARGAGIPLDSEDPSQAVLGQVTLEAVDKALASLPDEYREASTLYFVGDMSYEDISQILEIPLGTVRSRLYRGRRLLQKALWDQGLAGEAIHG